MAFAVAILVPAQAFADGFNPALGVYRATRHWYQLSGDDQRGIYRSFSLLVDQGKLIDGPNLFMLNCSRKLTYLTIHFPEHYRFKGFSANTAIPETDVQIVTRDATYSYKAELRQNEFFIDLWGDDFNQIQDVWRGSDAFELQLGPNGDRVAVSLSTPDYDDLVLKTFLLSIKDRTLIGKFTSLEMQTRCLADQARGTNPKRWYVIGSADCPSCADTGKGRTYLHFHIGQDEAKPITSEAECYQAKRDFADTVRKQNLVPDLLCVMGD